MDDTPRARSPRPVPPLSSEPTVPDLPPPPPPPQPLSGASSPSSSSHDFAFAFSFYSASSSPFGGHHLLHPAVSSMSRAPIGRVVSDIGHNHNSYAKESSVRHHPTTSKDDYRGRAKNRTAPFFPDLGGVGGVWRKKESSSNRGDKTKQGDEKRKDSKAKQRALHVGQWMKKYVTAMVEQLRSSYRHAESREQRRRRPHSFSGHGPARGTKEWMRRRGQQLSSAPASLRDSPANSGHLSVGGSVTAPSKSSEESTMEELQSAIEAAIAHCKKSISRDPADDGRRGK